MIVEAEEGASDPTVGRQRCMHGSIANARERLDQFEKIKLLQQFLQLATSFLKPSSLPGPALVPKREGCPTTIL
jgi:hypothetical protein